MTRIVVMSNLAETLVVFRGDMLRELVRRGHEVYTVAPKASDEVVATLLRWGVRFHPIYFERTGTRPVSDLRLLWQLYRWLLKVKPDVLLGYTIKPVVYGSLAARWAGVPRIGAMITGLGYTFMPPQHWRAALVQQVARILYKWALQAAHVVYFQNQDDESEFRQRKLLPLSIATVRLNGSGVHLQRFAPAPWPQGPMCFLFVGRVIRDKGVEEFIAASGQLRRAGFVARCQVVGPYDDNPSALSREEVESAAERGDIEYLGPTTDVRPYIAGCHVFVLPSYREGTPRSVLEALAMGRPALTTDAPGCRDTVEPGVSGWLVPPRDADALAQQMAQLCRLGPLAMQQFGAAARKRAEDKYDVHQVNSVLLGALLGEHSPTE